MGYKPAKAGFQCPATGVYVEAYYAFGKLSIGVDWEQQRAELADMGRSTHEIEDAVEKTRQWIDSAVGKYPTREAAERALVRRGVDAGELDPWYW